MTKTEIEALEALAASWDYASDAYACAGDLRQLLATLTPATRYDWSLAEDGEEWATTDEDGEVGFHQERPRERSCENAGGYWYSDDEGENGVRWIGEKNDRFPDWRESLERRPNA